MSDERTQEPTAADHHGHDDGERPKALTLDSAYEALQDAKASAAEAAELADEGRADPPAQGDDHAGGDDGTRAAYEAEVQRLQQDYAAFERDVREANLDELERADKGRAEALKADLRQRAQEINARGQQLSQAQAHIAQQAVAGEYQKLTDATPELADADNRRALRDWLVKEQGYSRADVEAVTDARTVALAWRAYQAAQAQDAPRQGKRKVPKLRPGARQSGRASGDERAVRSSSGRGMVTASEARKRLSETGSSWAALDLLRAEDASRRANRTRTRA